MSRPDLQHPRNSAAPTRERRGGKAMLDSLCALYGDNRPARIPDNWRDCLPDAAAYYGQHVAKLGQPKANGYALGLCPFHDDHTPSFGVNLTDPRGHWICYAGCGRGDIVAYHQRRTGLDFKAAVRELIGGSR
jgi:hypothetical protein